MSNRPTVSFTNSLVCTRNEALTGPYDHINTTNYNTSALTGSRVCSHSAGSRSCFHACFKFVLRTRAHGYAWQTDKVQKVTCRNLSGLAADECTLKPVQAARCTTPLIDFPPLSSEGAGVVIKIKMAESWCADIL